MVMLTFRGELDHGPVVELSDFDARANVAALVEQPLWRARAWRSCFANLEAAHGRPALFGIVGGGGSQCAFEIGDIGALQATETVRQTR
jgi:hypothetical protein